MAADIEDSSEWQVKAFIENAAESHSKDLKAIETRLILWCGVIAIIALASAGLRIGVIGVAALVIGRCYLWRWYMERLDSRVNRFRRRFRELSNREYEMRPEDKEFLRKYADSILFPLAVATQSREAVNRRDLEHVEVLYQESYLGNFHPRSGPQDGCKLCMAAQSLREHLNGVLSKVETTMTSARQKLVSGIDGSDPKGAIQATNLLEDFRENERWRSGRESHPLVALDKECWTFEEADNVLGIYRMERDKYHTSYDTHEQSRSRVLERLQTEIERAAARCNLSEVLWSYQDSSRALGDGSLELIRRFVGRRNPEAMIREMAEGGLDSFSFWWSQPHVLLGNYGYDRNLVKREIRRAMKLILKDKWVKEREKELRAAQVWAGCIF